MNTASDSLAIRNLDIRIATQKAAFLRDPYPSAEERRAHLGALASMMLSYRPRIIEALNADFGTHPQAAGELIEVLGVAGRAAFAAENVHLWMKPEDRVTDPVIFGTGRAYVLPQPKGVIGNMVPWNFPFDLSVGPLVEMLAAGNRVVIKPSEFTPVCAQLLREMLAATFDRDVVDVAVGGLELSKVFPTKRWDHLLFTGSPQVGRLVALAAADNLVPVTLELGGKCPAILADDAVDARTVGHILGIKLIKDGQMCISVDYCLVPRAKLSDFVRLARTHAHEHLRGHSQGPDCTGIINSSNLNRLCGLLDEARSRGCEVITLEEGGSFGPDSRRMPLSLVIDPPEDLALMREEIFGPILPVRPYDSIDEVITGINSGERPLGIYVFAHDQIVARQVQYRTLSGGFCHNAAAVHGAIPSLGFGGIGHSGSGRHHGLDGFREFSNLKGVFVRGDNDHIDALAPPYGPLASRIIAAALGD
ncbi:MAG: aldehyde dehydrogenase [Nevskia sp.]|nr:aldehyde dehydrogenase [Nevskia sp.]